MAKFASSAAAEFTRLSGYQFDDQALLALALTHPSHTAGSGGDYQRLEFLGDRVLGLVMADWLYESQATATEGQMSRQLAFLVRKSTCAEVAREIGLAQIVRTAVGGRALEGKSGTNILGDVCEAVIAAIYLDGGFAEAREFILKSWAGHLKPALSVERDAKSSLQEWALGKGLDIPEYREVSRSGPDHKPEFEIEVEVAGYPPARARATSKRRGEHAAAAAFLKREGVKSQ